MQFLHSQSYCLLFTVRWWWR